MKFPSASAIDVKGEVGSPGLDPEFDPGSGLLGRDERRNDFFGAGQQFADAGLLGVYLPDIGRPRLADEPSR